MLGPQNAQDFIRALKAASDPPHVGGPLKIDIAREAWENTHLYVPNKAEAIVEWLLTRLLKDKSRDRQSNPLCDTRYWDLLARVLRSSGADKYGDHGRALRAWLVPLLNRVPIAPIVLSYLEVNATGDDVDLAQYKLFAQCIAILWPLAVPKFSPETLLECFGAALHSAVALGGPEVSDDHLQVLDDHRALSLIVSSYRASLSNSASKRKQIYTLFLQKHLESWLQATTRYSEGEAVHSPLASDIYDAGIETIFGLDILKPSADQKHESALADALERTLKVSPEIVLRPLPRLFASYVHTLKRHKGALFGQGSSQAPGQTADQLQVAAMAFYAACCALTQAGADDLSWSCRVALLGVVEREHLVNPKDDNAKARLRRDGDMAVEALTAAWDEQHLSRTTNAVKVLASLTRIDYDLMSVSSAVVFPRLATVPSSVSSALEFLNLLLEYDSKSRSLPTSIMHISDAFSVQHLQRIPGGPKGAYKVVASGPLTSLPFHDELSRAVHSFLTPGQVLETIADVKRTLEASYESFLEREARLSADRGEGPRKKRKKDTSLSEDRTEPEYYAVSFVLVARTVVVVLRSLPLHTLTEETRVEAQRAIGEVYSAVATRALEKSLQSNKKQSWHWQAVITGALRLHYGLVRMPEMQQQLHLNQAVLSSMLSSVTTPGFIPELAVEMFRTLLHQCSIATLQPTDVLDTFIGYLESHIPSQKTTWTGKAHSLSSDAEAALASLHLLADRWLPYFDMWSTPEHRKRFVRILTNVRLDDTVSGSGSGLTVSVVISRLLHDAHFWELLGIRDAFLAQLNEQAASLDQHELSALLSNSKATDSSRAAGDVLRYASVYHVLLLAPPEYLPRPLQVDLLKRGFVADVLTFRALSRAGAKISPRHLLVIREFLRRTISFLGNVDNVVTKEFLDYLVEHATANCEDGATDEDLSTVTMELINMYQGTLVRSAKRGSAELVTALLDRYGRHYTTEGPSTSRRAALLLVDSFVREASSTDFPEEVVHALGGLYKQMLAYSIKHLPTSAIPEVTLDLDVLNTWAHVQTLRRWLKAEDADVPSLGKGLVRRLLTWTGDQHRVGAFAPVVLSILLGEVQTATGPAEREERLQYLVVAYLSLGRVCGQHQAHTDPDTFSTEVSHLESRMGTACRAFSAEDFGLLLELIYEGLPLRSGLSTQDIASLIRFSAVVLHHAPEGTSRICQSFTTRCLNLFADEERFSTHSDLRKEVVDFIVRQCNDRPASLRTADLSSLWSLVRSLVASSSVHEPSTDAAVFQGVVNILSALVRLRRDLVLNTLPHLGFVLRQLVFCLRNLRPQLGGKQSRLVMDTLPRWIAPSQPLSSQESRALARLLTTLTTKTMVRVHGAAAETQKPESLVRPFSKHAAYVLTAYVEAVNDPLCFVSAGVRKELQPGLFALCDMLGEHNRDAMMVSALDTGGKATMKVLWKEYEKQRYVGKG
ncbi:hypothetical protein BV20DRAFT_977085 [Pilatotrama ljubarskyi]|nr:hypothetical protein BV20DRAFT_977085 [Pilatotrama ljubarskyi]